MQSQFLKYSKVLILALGMTLSHSFDAWALENPIYIIHTNDIHCGVNDNIGLAKVAAYRKDVLKKTPHVALVDAGDAIQGTPLGTLTTGQAVINIMNAVGYDVLVPGNHEFDYGMKKFFEANANSSCGYYCANLMDLRTGKQVLPGYKLMTFEDTKVAFVGAVTPSTTISSTPKFFQDQHGNWIYGFCDDKNGKKLYRQLQQNINAARKEGAKYVFVVAHLGINGVKKEWSSPAVAKQLKGIVGVIDGHSHETFNRFELSKSARMVSQTGSKLNNLGLIIINPDGSIEMNMENRYSLRQKPDEAVSRIIKAETDKLADILSQKVGETSVKLCLEDPKTGKRLIRTQESNLSDFVSDAYRQATGAEIVLLNGGNLRKNIQKGTITSNSILEALPFNNMLVTARVSGQQLLDCLEMGARKLPSESGAFMHISGGSYTIDTTIPSAVEFDTKGNFLGVKGPYRVKDVVINDQPLDRKKTYLMSGIAYTLKNGGDGMSMFKGCEIIQDETISEFDAVRSYINELGGVIGQEYANPYGQERIKIVN